MIHSRIVGTGSYLPPRIVTNDELAKRLDTSDAWIRERTGIRQRHIAEDSQTSSDLAPPERLSELGPLHRRARVAQRKTSSIMGAVSLPVLVFCRLG